MSEEIVGRPPSNEIEGVDPSVLTEANWDEFRKTGLMWWLNRQLQLFGWALVVEIDPADPERTLRVYPARSEFRGFCPEVEGRGFKNLTTYLHENIGDLKRVTDDLEPPPLGG